MQLTREPHPLIPLALWEQITIAAWLSMGVVSVIQSRSWNGIEGYLLLGVFAALPMFASRALRASHTWRVAGRVALAMWFAGLLFVAFEIVEGAYVHNGDSYPRWLATATVSKHQLSEIELACKGRGVMHIMEKEGGTGLVRCGTLWHESKTFITDFYRVPLLDGDQK